MAKTRYWYLQACYIGFGTIEVVSITYFPRTSRHHGIRLQEERLPKSNSIMRSSGSCKGLSIAIISYIALWQGVSAEYLVGIGKLPVRDLYHENRITMYVIHELQHWCWNWIWSSLLRGVPDYCISPTSVLIFGILMASWHMGSQITCPMFVKPIPRIQFNKACQCRICPIKTVPMAWILRSTYIHRFSPHSRLCCIDITYFRLTLELSNFPFYVSW